MNEATPPPDPPPESPPKLFGWLMAAQEEADNADVRGEILREASRLLQEYLGKEGEKK